MNNLKQFKSFIIDRSDRDEYPFHTDIAKREDKDKPKVTTKAGESVRHDDHTITFHDAEKHNLEKEGRAKFVQTVSDHVRQKMTPHLSAMENQFGHTILAKVKNNANGDETFHHINISKGKSPTSISHLGKHEAGNSHNDVLSKYLSSKIKYK